VIVEQVEKFFFVKVSWLGQQCAIPPLLRVPMVWGALDSFVGWLRYVEEFVPLFVFSDFVVD